MPLVHRCAEPGCHTLTMGRLCVDHERAEAPDAQPKPTLRRLRTPAIIAVSALAGSLIRVHKF